MSNKTEENKNADLTAVKQFYASWGYHHNEISKLLKNGMRDVALIQKRFADYKKLLRIDDKKLKEIFLKNSKLLTYETKGKHISTSVESKLLDWQNTFHLDEPTLIQKIVKFPNMLDAGKLEDVIAGYQRILQADQATVKKLILQRTNLAAFDVDKNIAPTLTFYRNTLQINQTTLNQMILRYPAILEYDISESPTSVKSKIEKLNEVMPFAELRTRAIQHPRILGAPANAFKFRYMLAVIADNYAGNNTATNGFFSGGFVSGQDRVWAVLCYFKSMDIKAMSYLYSDEKKFNKYVGVKTEDLKQQYPLDANAVNQIRQEYLRITHRLFELNPQELGKMNMTRNPADAVIPDDTRSL